MDRVVVTGGSGKAGRAVTRVLVDTGYDVVNVDLVPSSDPASPFLAVDLTKLGRGISSVFMAPTPSCTWRRSRRRVSVPRRRPSRSTP